MKTTAMKRAFLFLILMVFVFPTIMHAQTSWTYVQDSLVTACSTNVTSCTWGSFNMVSTTAKSVWVVAVQTTNNVTISSVSGGGGSWTLCPASSCHLYNATLPRNIDIAYNLTGNTGTNSITVNLSGNSGAIFGANFLELLPPVGNTAMFDIAGTSVSTSCTPTCTGVGLTLSATDAVIQVLHANSVQKVNAWSSPYFTTPLGEGVNLNAANGNAPTVTVTGGAGAIFSAIAFKSTAGFFTPPSQPISIVQQKSVSNPSCNPTCSISIASTGTGHLLYIQSGTLNGSNITAVSAGGTWVFPSGANSCRITLSATNDVMSCGYVLSSTGGVTSLTVTMSGNSNVSFEVWEIASTTGPFLFDTQGSAQRAAAFNQNGVALIPTGTSDIIFQSAFVPGGTSGATLYQDGDLNFFNTNAGQIAEPNTADGSAPTWVNEQNSPIAVAAIAFMTMPSPVDAFINMENVSPVAPGTTLTTAMVNNGTFGPGVSFSSINGSGFTVGVHSAPCSLGTPISNGGTIFTPAFPSQSISLDNTGNFDYLKGSISSTPKLSVAGCITFGGVPNTTNLMDMVRINGSLGGYAVLQLRNGSCIDIETDGNGTQHSGCITPSGNQPTYWCTMLADPTNSIAKARCYQSVYPYTQIGSEISVVMRSSASMGSLNGIYMGNAETGTAAGTFNIFENMIFDLTNSSYPLGVGTSYAPWVGILSPTRAIDWSKAGVTGRIPARLTICSTLSAGATSAQIQSASSSCPAGETVFLSAGSYNLAGLDFTGINNVTLRGAGADQTSITLTATVGCNVSTGTGICIGGTDNNWKGGISNGPVSFTGPYFPGTTTINLASVPNLKVGNPIILDQVDDTDTGCDLGGVLVTQANSPCSGNVSPGLAGPFSLEGNGGGSARTSPNFRQQEQIVIVARCDGVTVFGHACASGANITISPGLYMPNWRSSQTPQAWWATTPITGIGIENLSIDGLSISGTTIQIKNATNSWVKGVRSGNGNRAHVQTEYTSHITVQDGYDFLDAAGLPTNYGFECYGGSDSLVQNMIFQAITGPLLLNSGCEGNVIAYNFTVNQYYTQSAGWNETASSIHTAGSDMNYYEGNVMNTLDADVFHGSHNHNTYFRGLFAGNQLKCWSSGATYATSVYAACNNNRNSLQIRSFSRFHSIIGNVLDTSGVATTYQASGGTFNYDSRVYVVGNGNSNGTVTVPADPNVATTLMRWANWDLFNNATQFNLSEVPTAPAATVQTPFANYAPTLGNTGAGQPVMPASFYLTAKPAFFATAKPFPPIGPDVSGGNIANSGGHAYTIPAEDCYLNVMGGLADGTGPLLSFNANTCYFSSSAPAPPTGLTVTVQ